MADVLPKFKVTDPHTRAGSTQDRRDTGKHASKGESECQNSTVTPMLIIETVATNGKLAANLRSPTSPTQSNEAQNSNGSEERGTSDAAIDPLSQVCIS